jgi:hypothetical protein
MRSGRTRTWIAAGVASLAPRLASACPDCAPLRAARAAIREDPAFGSLLLVTVLPFVIVALVAAGLHRLGRPSREVPRP